MAKKGKVGALSVSLSLNSAQFSSALKKARKRVGAFGKSIRAGAMKAAKFGAALGAVAVGAIGVFTRQSLKMIDATAKAADRLGITTEELTSLQHAASLMGSSAEGMNKGLKEFSRRLGEAQTGTGEAKKALDELGLSGEDLAKMGLAKAFKLAADRINALEDQTIKANTAYNLFGRTGVELLNTLSLGSRGLETIAREAEQLGISFSRVDAAKVEEANDAITRLRGVFRGAFNVLAVQLAPFIKDLADRFTSAGKAGGGMADRVKLAFETVLVIVGKLADALSWMKTQFAKVAAAINAFIKPVVDALIWLDDLTKDLPGGGGGKTGEALRGFSDTLAKNTQYWSDMAARGEMGGPKLSEQFADYTARVRGMGSANAVPAVAGAAAAGPMTQEQGTRLIATLERVGMQIGNLGLMG